MSDKILTITASPILVELIATLTITLVAPDRVGTGLVASSIVLSTLVNVCVKGNRMTYKWPRISL